MQTSLRKMGNSTGLIVPRAMLGEIGVTTGATMDLRVEDGKLIVTPAPAGPRAGWAEDAAALGDETEEEMEWSRFGNEADADLEW
jgi:antitoxin MazE